MGIENTEKTEGTKKRLSLGDSKAVRAALCKLARAYHNNQIPDVKIRNLTYILNSILGADKFINVESELTAKFEQLEKMVNGSGGGTTIDPALIDNAYAQDLKRELDSERLINVEMNNQILSLKRQLAGQRAEPAQGGGIGQI